MLVLSRKTDEKILIGDDIVITVLGVRGDQVRLGISAPRDVSVLREELVNAMTTYRAKAAAGVVIDVSSGEVVAMVSLPDYDPNFREQALDKDRLNRMISGVYELGSVFKVFTLAGALDGGSATMRSSYDASQPIRVGRFTIEDFHGKKRRLTDTYLEDPAIRALPARASGTPAEET